LRPRVVARQERVGLHVEEKAGRRALGPAQHVPRGRDRVVRAVDLDGVEEARVEPQARLGGHGFPGIERAVLDQGLVGPRANADADQLIFSYTPGGITLNTGIGWLTFLNVFSPRLSSTQCIRLRSAVAGPT